MNALAGHLKETGKVQHALAAEILADARASPDLASTRTGAVPKLFKKKLGG